MPDKVIITLPDHNLSNSAAGRSKHWFKLLTGINTTKSDGFAFLGAFHDFGATVEVPEGTWFLSLIEDVRGSGRIDGRDVVLYRVVDGELTTADSWRLDGNRGWALKVRDQIAQLMHDAQPRIVEIRDEMAEVMADPADTSPHPGGRPPIGEPFKFTLPDDLRARIDEQFRAQYPEIGSTAEAIRRLLTAALADPGVCWTAARGACDEFATAHEAGERDA